MIEGTLIAESLRVGTTLENLELVIRKISRYRAQGSTPDQPDIWTTLEFEAEAAGAEQLAEIFADALDQPGWYANFQSSAVSFVIFPGRILPVPTGRQGWPGRGPGLRAAASHSRAPVGLDGVRQPVAAAR